MLNDASDTKNLMVRYVFLWLLPGYGINPFKNRSQNPCALKDLFILLRTTKGNHILWRAIQTALLAVYEVK